jgi:hypothetical protein
MTAEDLLREIACALGVGGYNADAVDVEVFRRKIHDGLDMLTRPLAERAQAAESEVSLLRGTIEAQDGRERAAGAACGVPYEEHGCDWPNAVAEEVARLRHIITGHEKGGALMAAGMESQCELMATMKQEMRAAQVASAYYRSLLERLTDACEVGIVATYGEVVDEVIAKAKAALADKGGDL